VGPQEKEWDSGSGEIVEQESHAGTAPEIDDLPCSFDHDQDHGFSSPVIYPMYIPPFSPHFDHGQQDPYQAQNSFQMLGTPYSDSPVYAGTPCGQINLSPEQAVFPFTTYPLDSTADQNTPMSPQEYARSHTAYFQSSMEVSSGNMTPTDLFAPHTSPPEVSDIPADYAGYDGFQVDFDPASSRNDSQAVSSTFSNSASTQASYPSYDSGNQLFSQPFHSLPHHAEDNPTDTGMYMSHHSFASNQQPSLEGI
jgi:hypothetical protein